MAPEVNGNGAHVTWRELRLLIDPIQQKVNEIGFDVKHLLAQSAGDEAVSAWQRWFFGVVCVGVFTGVVAIVALALGA